MWSHLDGHSSGCQACNFCLPSRDNDITRPSSLHRSSLLMQKVAGLAAQRNTRLQTHGRCSYASLLRPHCLLRPPGWGYLPRLHTAPRETLSKPIAPQSETPSSAWRHPPMICGMARWPRNRNGSIQPYERLLDTCEKQSTRCPATCRCSGMPSHDQETQSSLSEAIPVKIRS